MYNVDLRRSVTIEEIVWAICTGNFPNVPLDHINGVRDDNRPANLRLATASLNARNRRTGNNNTSGAKGVTWVPHLSKWKAEITCDNKRIYLGVFSDLQQAKEEYERAAEKHFAEFRRAE